MENMANSQENHTIEYEELEKKSVKHSGKPQESKRLGQINPPKPQSPAITRAHKEKKEAKRNFDEACRTGNQGEKKLQLKKGTNKNRQH